MQKLQSLGHVNSPQLVTACNAVQTMLNNTNQNPDTAFDALLATFTVEQLKKLNIAFSSKNIDYKLNMVKGMHFTTEENK